MSVIVETPHGPIEWLFTGRAVVLQFNTTCEDALPYCHAMCCRLRPMLNLSVDPDQAGQYEIEPGTPDSLKVDREHGCCTYLRSDRCAIHATKPRACQRWHCSPGGQGEGITERHEGWMLFPNVVGLSHG